MGKEVKYYINCQTKHGLSNSSVKTGKVLLFVMGHPLPAH